MKMENYGDYQKFMRTMSLKETQNVRGGRNWPFFDLLAILQDIYVGEDLTLGEIIPKKY